MTVGGTQMALRVSTSDRDAVDRQVRWCAAVQTTVNCHCQLHVEPVKFTMQYLTQTAVKPIGLSWGLSLGSSDSRWSMFPCVVYWAVHDRRSRYVHRWSGNRSDRNEHVPQRVCWLWGSTSWPRCRRETLRPSHLSMYQSEVWQVKNKVNRI